LVLRLKAPLGLCPINRVRGELVVVALKELLDIICQDALQKFRRSRTLFPPLKRILKTDEDQWRA